MLDRKLTTAASQAATRVTAMPASTIRSVSATNFSSACGVAQDGGADSLRFEGQFWQWHDGASRRSGGRMKLMIEIPDDEATYIKTAVARMALYDDRANTHDTVTIESLAQCCCKTLR